MAITSDPNYLAHYGVLGMKWGVRKSSSSGRSGGLAKKAKQKYVQKREEKKKELQKTTDRFGVTGVAVGKYLGYSSGHALRGTLATVINGSANAYISNNSSKHRISTGVDYARRASISYLSLRDSAEKINAVADVGKAAIYSSKKKRDT